ncbi:MAG TPA: DUF4164 family protein [Rhizomicrobium sp.]|jgi:peptidoglycan hydrolase CwlO-like protein|nr:DUF4164 family protein [Rhizomicrobium sp.]
MSRLDEAADRFQAALERLENSAMPLPQNGHEQAAKVVDLEAERERLLAKIATLEEEMGVLTEITEEVEGRLDGAIGEFRAALSR